VVGLKFWLTTGVIRAIDLREAQMKKLVFLLYLVIAVASATVGQTAPAHRGCVEVCRLRGLAQLW
jgi:hypothetical protein